MTLPRKYRQQPPEKTQAVSPDPKSVQMEATVQIIYTKYDKTLFQLFVYLRKNILSLFYILVIIAILFFGYMQTNIFPSSKIKQRERQVTQNIV